MNSRWLYKSAAFFHSLVSTALVVVVLVAVNVVDVSVENAKNVIA